MATLSSKFLQDENGNKYAPITTPNAVRWPDGSNLNDKLSNAGSGTNTTYSLDVGTDQDADKIILTPSTGEPDKITVPYATTAGSAPANGGNATTVNSHSVNADVPANAVFTDTHHDGSVIADNGYVLTKVEVSSAGVWSKEQIAIPAAQIQSDWNQTDNTQKDFIKNKPTDVGDFTNNAGFITKVVNDLTNYYLKNEVYTKTEVTTLIRGISQFTYQVVSTLPTASADTMRIIYLTPSSSPQAQNVKDEYITIDNGELAETRYTWEQIGSTSINLTNYYTKSETDTAIATELLDYTPTSNLATVATSGDYDDLTNKPPIPAAQVNSDWDSNSGVSQILNKPTIPSITFRQW